MLKRIVNRKDKQRIVSYNILFNNILQAFTTSSLNVLFIVGLALIVDTSYLNVTLITYSIFWMSNSVCNNVITRYNVEYDRTKDINIIHKGFAISCIGLLLIQPVLFYITSLFKSLPNISNEIIALCYVQYALYLLNLITRSFIFAGSTKDETVKKLTNLFVKSMSLIYIIVFTTIAINPSLVIIIAKITYTIMLAMIIVILYKYKNGLIVKVGNKIEKKICLYLTRTAVSCIMYFFVSFKVATTEYGIVYSLIINNLMDLVWDIESHIYDIYYNVFLNQRKIRNRFIFMKEILISLFAFVVTPISIITTIILYTKFQSDFKFGMLLLFIELLCFFMAFTFNSSASLNIMVGFHTKTSMFATTASNFMYPLVFTNLPYITLYVGLLRFVFASIVMTIDYFRDKKGYMRAVINFQDRI